MGTVTVQPYNTCDPYEVAGYEAGTCYNSDVSDKEKNIKRGKNCYKSGHHRAMEYVQIYLTLDGYSARVLRQLYTHIGGAPTRLQESTRYVNYDNFSYIVPKAIQNDDRAIEVYNKTMESIRNGYDTLVSMGMDKEDAGNVLPLGMCSKMVFRTNLRQLIDMSHERLCNRAYWEFRELMKDIKKALSDLSPNWKEICDEYLQPKCVYLGHCPEIRSCKSQH